MVKSAEEVHSPDSGMPEFCFQCCVCVCVYVCVCVCLERAGHKEDKEHGSRASGFMEGGCLKAEEQETPAGQGPSRKGRWETHPTFSGVSDPSCLTAWGVTAPGGLL